MSSSTVYKLYLLPKNSVGLAFEALCFCKIGWYNVLLDDILHPDVVYVLWNIQNDNSLQWRHNGRDGVSNHQLHHCLLNRLFRRRSKETSKLSVTSLCAGNSPVTGEFSASNAENDFLLDDVIMYGNNISSSTMTLIPWDLITPLLGQGKSSLSYHNRPGWCEEQRKYSLVNKSVPNKRLLYDLTSNWSHLFVMRCPIVLKCQKPV